MICRKCGVKNKDTRTRCFHCGASLEKKTITSTPSPEITTEPITEENTIPEFVVESVIENAIDESNQQKIDSAPIVEPIPEIVVEPIAEEIITETDSIVEVNEEATDKKQDDEEISNSVTLVEGNETVIEEVP